MIFLLKKASISNLTLPTVATFPMASNGEAVILSQTVTLNNVTYAPGAYVYVDGWIKFGNLKYSDLYDLPTTLAEAGIVDAQPLLNFVPVNKAGDVATNILLAESKVRQAPDQTAASGSVVLNYANGDYFKVTATGNISIAVTISASHVAGITLEAINFGAFTTSWPAGMLWSGGAAPALTSSGRDLLSFVRNGNNALFGFLLGRDVR